MNEVLRVLREHRGCCSYRLKQITGEELNAVLKAGTYVSMARGQQSPIIVAVQNPAVVEQLQKMNAVVLGTSEADPFYGAPTALVVLAVRDDTNRVYDGNCVMSNLTNVAKAVGLASYWVRRTKEVPDSEEGKALLRQRGTEGDYEDIGHCILGYRTDTAPALASRKEHYVYWIRQGGKQVPRPSRGTRCLRRRDRVYTW